MINKDGRDQEEIDVVQDAADAWAEVYIDVAEKLDKEESQESKNELDEREDDEQPA